jgi:hypothetical protein
MWPVIFGGICTHFCRELSAMVTFLDATGVNPEVFQVVLSSLFSTEPDLLIARLLLASAISQVFESDLRSIRSPCVRKYRVGRDCIVVNEVLAKAELARFAASQKSHCFAWSLTAGRLGEETGVQQVACGPGISYLAIEVSKYTRTERAPNQPKKRM